MTTGNYETVEVEQLLKTIRLLGRRIHERFPQAGLYRVSLRLLQVAEQAAARSRAISRPAYLLRFLSAVLIASILGVTGFVAWHAPIPEKAPPLYEFIQVLEAGLNDLLLIGATLFFVVTLEGRYKRRRALAALHELRALAHIIDMHQLTKDPERLKRTADEQDTPSSPTRDLSPFLLSRYLDYCSEMLALIGKIAVVYVQEFNDPQAVAAVNEIEDLTNGLARKIWQKIMILHAEPLREPPRAEPGVAAPG